MGEVKAITLWQPWASLVAVGVKKLETRSWYTKHRGSIAIHAAAKSPKLDTLMDESATLKLINIVYEWCRCTPDALPHGAVIAVANLTECYKVNRHLPGFGSELDIDLRDHNSGITVSSNSIEYLCGDFLIGRYAWEFKNVVRIAPIPAKGKQGLWTWEWEDDSDHNKKTML